VNSISLIGRVGRDVESRSVGKESKIYSTSIAVYKGTDKDGKAESFWIKVEAWNKTGELLERFAKKGQLVGVSGRLDIQEYTDKEGQKKQSTLVKATEISPCGAKQEGSSGGGNGFSSSDIEQAKKKAAATAAKASAAEFSADDEIPF